MMLFINDLLDLKDRNIYLEKEGEKIPMCLHFYIADDIIFFQIDKDSKMHTLNDLREIIEIEAQDSCWNDDIYCSPMERLGRCEIRFPRNFFEMMDKSTFDDCYKIMKMTATEDEVVIHLK